MAEALELLRGIAHSAVRCQFHADKTGPDVYVDMLDKSLRFYALPNTYPAGDPIQYRNLISAKRLYAMSGNNETITAVLQAHAKIWYQQSPFTFLEEREGYHTYEDVRYFLYALADEQLERLRNDFVRYIREEFRLVKAKPQPHHAEHLLAMLEAALSWKAGEIAMGFALESSCDVRCVRSGRS